MASTSIHDAAQRALSLLSPDPDEFWPIIVLVDKGAGEFVKAIGGAMVLIHLFKCSTVAALDCQEDVFCMDLGQSASRLVIVLLTTPLAHSDTMLSLTNALKHSPENTTIQIASWFHTSPADLARLSDNKSTRRLQISAIHLNLSFPNNVSTRLGANINATQRKRIGS